MKENKEFVVCCSCVFHFKCKVTRPYFIFRENTHLKPRSPFLYLFLQFESVSGIKISMVNIDMCLREKCESGGCSNILEVGDKPNYVNTNGTSFIGIATTVRADCQCKARDYSSPPECTPGYCYNGGTCIKDEWGDVK